MKHVYWLKPKPTEYLTPSVILLVVANLVPFYGVFFSHWKVFPILILFWMENVVIGIFNVFKMLLASPTKPSNWLTKILIIPFFCFHYGIFTLVHGIFVFAFFGDFLVSDTNLSNKDLVFQTIGNFQLGWAILALFLSHALSFAINYIGKGEYKQANVDNLASQPYLRVFIMQVTIIAGGFLATSFGSPVFALLVLIFLKTFIDIQAHLREHKQYTNKQEASAQV
jgi:uncharacterized membrane protein